LFLEKTERWRVDQELREYLQGMEARLEERFGRLEERFVPLEEQGRRTEERFSRLEEQGQRTEERFVRLEEQGQRTEERFSRLEALMDQRFAEQRRHTEVLIEAVRGDVRLVAEGVAGVSERLDIFQEDTTRKFATLDRRVTVLEARASRRVGKKRPTQ
jgi:hypothetical protein